jgi:GH24 family phage-related lysozyme (muramidase)
MSIANAVGSNKRDLQQLILRKHPSITLLKPKEGTRTSKYWSQFTQIYLNNVRQDFIVCDICQSLLVYKSTTGSGCMLAHSRSCSKKETNRDPPTKQQQIDQFYASSSKNKCVPARIKDTITDACVKFVVQDGRPFHLVEGSGFLQLAKELFNAGRLMATSTSISVEDLIPNPTTVSNVSRIR